jgi:hypothetical protein
VSRIAALVPCLLLPALLAGCPDASAPATPAPAPPPADAPPAASAPAIPDSAFLAARPEGAAESLRELKQGTKAGDEVVFVARIGGRSEPFVKGRAIFLVADAGLKPCVTEEGNCCETPWDYCCETPEDLLKNVATVRFVDAAGDPIKASAQDHKGLIGLKTVVVRGTVKEADASGYFVVDAAGVWVEP